MNASANVVSNSALLLNIPFAIPDRISLIMLLLAAREADFYFDVGPFPVHIERNTCVPFLTQRTMDRGQLFFMQQQFSTASWVGNDMRRCRLERCNLRIQQVGFTFSDNDVRVGEVCFACANRLHLPAVQLQTGFKGFVDMVIKPCPFIGGDLI